LWTNIWTEVVFVIHLSGGKRITVGRFVWVMTNCCFMGEMLTGKYEGWNFNSGNYLFTTDTK